MRKTCRRFNGISYRQQGECKCGRNADTLWTNVSLLDDYIAEKGMDLSQDHKDILLSWKRCVKDEFFIERHLMSGSILISGKGNVYLV